MLLKILYNSNKQSKKKKQENKKEIKLRYIYSMGTVASLVLPTIKKNKTK